MRMPGSARQTYGMAFTQCMAVAAMPRLCFAPSFTSGGWSPWKTTWTGGSPVNALAYLP